MGKSRRIITDQLYNVAAGLLYAVSICYFAQAADFAPGGLSGLALIPTICGRCPLA